MCLIAIQYRVVPETPILVATNREEFYDVEVIRRASNLENRVFCVPSINVAEGLGWESTNTEFSSESATAGCLNPWVQIDPEVYWLKRC